MCIDYRLLSKQIVKDRYPQPLIEDHIDKHRGAKIFTSLDLKNRFFHVPVHKDSRKYTAFITPTGQYEFFRTPFGMCNSPAIFQKFINNVFQKEIKEGIVLIYMDDVIILAENELQAMERLIRVLRTAEEYGLIIN